MLKFTAFSAHFRSRYIYPVPNYRKLQIKEIADLSKTYRIWKVHWLGQLSINPSTSEMLIDVCLIPLLNTKKFKNGQNHEQLIYNLNFALKERQIVKVGVGQLPLLRVGAIYVDGFPYEYPQYITAKFSFTVTEKNQKIISLGASWGKWGKTEEEERTRYFIPALQYQVFFSNQSVSNKESVGDFRKAYPSKCLVLEFSEDERPAISLDEYPLQVKEWRKERGELGSVERIDHSKTEDITNFKNTKLQVSEVHGLIFPCLEMVRFYFTKSSQSCREILFGGLISTPNRMFDTTKTIKPSAELPKGFLMLSKYVRNRDAPIIARFAFDDYAMSQARNVFISSLNNKHREGAALPEVRFPFRNIKTDQVLHGTYLQSGNRIYFLVFWIESCTAEFPYKDIEFWRANPGSAAAPKTVADVWQTDTIGTDETLDTVKIESGKSLQQEDSKTKNNIKKKRNTDWTKLQSEDIPTFLRKRLHLLLNEKDRFPYLQDYSIDPRQPNSINIRGNPTEEIPTTFVGGTNSGLEIGGTAPRGGNQPITPVSITPDPSEIEDITADIDFDEIVDLPNLEDFVEKLEDSVSDIIDNQSENFDDEFPIPAKETEGENKRLAINLEVFREILGWLNKLEPQLQIRMIAVPPVGEPILTKTATTFPSRWLNSRWQGNLDDKGNSSPEIYIAEIKNERGYYAYLMDRKAVASSGGEIKGFQMFVCFVKGNHRKLKGLDLRQILGNCEKNGGKWLTPNMRGKRSNVLGYIAREKFKHDCNLPQTYAERVLKALMNEGWIYS